MQIRIEKTTNPKANIEVTTAPPRTVILGITLSKNGFFILEFNNCIKWSSNLLNISLKAFTSFV